MDELDNKNLHQLTTPEKILDALPVGLIAFDKNFDITFINDNIYRFGVLEEDPAMHHSLNLLSGIFISSLTSIEDDLRTLTQGDFVEKEIRSSQTLTGDEITVLLKAAPIFEGAEFLGGVLLVEDLKTKAAAPESHQSFSHGLTPIVKSLAGLVVLCDTSGKVIYFSNADPLLAPLCNKEQNAELNIHSTFEDNFQAEIEARIHLLGPQKHTESFIYTQEMPGEKIFVQAALSLISLSSDEPNLYLIAVNNVSNWLKETGELQKELEELRHYEEITNVSTDGVITVTASGDIRFWNKTAEQLFGLTRSQMFGKNFFKVTRLFPQEEFNAILSNLSEGEHIRKTVKYLHNDSEITILLLFSMFSRESEEGEILILCSDISSRVTAEKHIEELSARITKVYKVLPDSVIRFSSEGKLLEWNPAFEQMTGFTGQTGGISIYDFIPDTDVIRKLLSPAGESGYKTQCTITGSSGKKLTAEFSVFEDLPDDSGKNTFSAVIKDLTAQLHFEQELSLMQSVFASSEDGIAIESNGAYILANDAFIEMFGFSSFEELSQSDYFAIVSPEEKNLFKEYIRSRGAGENENSRFEFLAIRKDGSRFNVESSVSHFSFQDDEFTVLLIRDITERKRTQQAVKESEERYRSITENLEDFFWTAEKFKGQLKTTFYSAAVEKMIGYSQTDLLTDSKLFLKLIYPDDFAEVKRDLKNFYQNYYKRSTELVFRMLHKQGNIVWVRNKLTAVRDRKGEIIKMYGLVSDISSQKKAEQVLQESTDNLTKLNEAKDRFISIISHDLRTPFSSIMGFTDILLNDNEMTPGEVREYVKYIQDSAQSMLTLVNSLLDWTKLQTGRITFEPVRHDLTDIVNKIINTVQGVAMTKDIEIVNKIEKDIFVFVDEGLIMQVLNNLLSNALKFTKSGGWIQILAEHSEHPRFLKVTVKDNGVGISEDNLNQLFRLDSKLTTEGTAGEKGTGLGLTLAWEIVNRHGGKIWVESQMGEGSSFHFTLPKASANILLVDDSNTDRILYSKILKNITPDYEVLLASNGREALQLIESSAPALVITDHIMPVMNGLDFVRTLQYSNIKGKPQVIVLSGDLGKGETLAYTDLGIEHVFSKPVNLASFKEAVEKSLKKLLK